MWVLCFISEVGKYVITYNVLQNMLNTGLLLLEVVITYHGAFSNQLKTVIISITQF